MNEMSDKELIERYNKLPNLIAALDGKQMAYKIAMNSLYGAMANAPSQARDSIRSFGNLSDVRFKIN